MRVLSRAGATQILGQSFGRNTGAWAQEFDLDPDPPQHAVRCEQDGRSEPLGRNGNIVHRS